MRFGITNHQAPRVKHILIKGSWLSPLCGRGRADIVDEVFADYDAELWDLPVCGNCSVRLNTIDGYGDRGRWVDLP